MKTNISQYLSTKTNQEIAENVAQKLDLNKQSLTWYNKSTNTYLSNFAYNKMVIDEALADWTENKQDYLKDGITCSQLIINYFGSEEDFECIDQKDA